MMGERVRRLDPSDYREAYDEWVVRIGQMHEHPAPRVNPTAVLTRPSTPMSAWRVGLLTTAGAYLDGQQPFDVADPHGDASWRRIPHDSDLAAIRFAHSHYDTARAEQDPNVVLPIGPLASLVDDGTIAAAADVHVGMMGWNPDPTLVVERAAPAIVDHFARQQVDVVVMSPG
jgi:D-proline reductase (dithiol) PrdB